VCRFSARWLVKHLDNTQNPVKRRRDGASLWHRLISTSDALPRQILMRILPGEYQGESYEL